MKKVKVLTQELFNSLPANGWLSLSEAGLLYGSAQEVDGAILEVGCYHGRSSCLLATLGRTMHCVDPFSGFDSDDPTGDWVVRRWEENIRGFGVVPFLVNSTTTHQEVAHYALTNTRPVYLYRCKIEDWTPRPVGFAYLDGDHTYNGTQEQVKAALACRSGIIAIHDVGYKGDGKIIHDAAVALLGEWTRKADRLAIWDLRKKGKSNGN